VLEERKDWKLPPFDLLDDHMTEVDSGNIEANVVIIQKTLSDFGIEVEMGEVNVGPTVAQYTLRPATGVKLSQIAGLKNDLALALAAQTIRMELPIPGKSLVGVEVPNKTSRIVGLREVLQTTDFINHGSRLAFALGRDVAGKAQITDLAKMPHLLIAGATGKGKSVALNSLIISLLYRNTPQDVKFIMVDPKRVEMTVYNGIPHLLTPPITEPEKAVNALKWAVSEMDRRYRLLAEAKKRNIAEYNATSGLPLSYIVIIVDELADLMAVAQADIEATIVRLAQMARAIGIHLVLATQSPRTDIITGLIKANITSRVAFAVGSQIESRIILDMSGAESLLGNGDMLFVSSEFNKPLRIQGAYVNDKETHKVVDFFKLQTGAVIYNDEIVERPKHTLSIPGFDSGAGDGDEMLDAAKEEVLKAGKASASFLQRRLKVGYARAARLLDLLEEQGIIGPGEGAKPREVYGAGQREPGYGEASESSDEYTEDLEGR
jgi:S-DNA-T family DNA segregation ATPase FtsK/SpoIIIE